MITLLVTPWASRHAHAQVLDDFERDATQQRESTPAQPQPSQHPSHSGSDFYNQMHDNDDSESSLTEILLLVCGVGLIAGGINSWFRVFPPHDPKEGEQWTKPRHAGEPLIPFLRLDGSFQSLEHHVEAWDYRAQAGIGPFALEYGDSRYQEKSPADTLNVRRGLFLYRMSANHMLEIDMGFGTVELDGNTRQHSFCFALPILFYPKEYLGFEFRPSWASFHGSRFNEYDVAACATLHGLGFKAGYRWLVTPNAKLDGPYAGIVIRF